jgi:hypothetical protein
MRPEDQKEFDFNVAFAKTILVTNGNLQPMVVAKRGPDDDILLTPLIYTKEDKYAVINKLKEAYRSMGVTSITMMSEAWYSVHKLNDKDIVPPSAEENRREALVVVYRSKTDRMMATYEILRKGGRGPATVELKLIDQNHNDINTEDNLWDDLFVEKGENPWQKLSSNSKRRTLR